MARPKKTPRETWTYVQYGNWREPAHYRTSSTGRLQLEVRHHIYGVDDVIQKSADLEEAYLHVADSYGDHYIELTGYREATDAEILQYNQYLQAAMEKESERKAQQLAQARALLKAEGEL